ncbi:metallophosphoesterase [Sphingobacterium spiritivorum]|uniref:metallophosphoesterase n=1 Tax=Sphingobacterium spiritivorum TaxID=258 RepID=UPI003DA2534D
MLIINAVILFILDFYIFFALRATKIKLVHKKWFGYAWWAYSILLLTGVFIGMKYNIPLTYRSIILVAFFLTATCKFFFFLVILIDDIRRGGVWISRLLRPARKKEQLEDRIKELEKPLPETPKKGISRSEFLMKSGIVIASLPILPLGWGIVSGAYDYRIRRKKLYLPNLPASFHGMRIAQISDVHSGSFYNKKAVNGGIDMLLGEKPDAIFFTGDLVNNVASEMRDYQDIFTRVKADLGVFSTLGNHDYGDYYYGKEDSPAKRKNLQDVIDTHKVMGWDLLMDENRTLKVGNEEIAIVGVQNWGTGRFPKKGDLKKALMGTEEQPVKLLLSHDPSHWRAQVLDTDVDVMFAGHTHGMQFGVRTENFQWSPVKYIYKEWAGLYREKQNKQLYVNVGYGFLGYPGRVGILPEITIFELIKGTKPVV